MEFAQTVAHKCKCDQYFWMFHGCVSELNCKVYVGHNLSLYKSFLMVCIENRKQAECNVCDVLNYSHKQKKPTISH